MPQTTEEILADLVTSTTDLLAQVETTITNWEATIATAIADVEAAANAAIAAIPATAQYQDTSFVAGFDEFMDAEPVAVQSYGQSLMARTGSFTGESLYADVAPVGAALIVDIEKNGVSIYATPPQIAAGANSGTAGTLKTDGTEDFVAGDRVTLKVTQVGSSVAGSGVRVTITGTLA